MTCRLGTARYLTRVATLELFWIFLRLGLSSFGGPAAHLGYFRTEFVERRRWLSDGQYADLVALAQFLPGPASSQVNLAIGYLRAGAPGALLAWAGFTLPSALLLAALGLGLGRLDLQGGAVVGLLGGLEAAAAAVVAHALVGMWRSLIGSPRAAAVALAAAAACLAWPGAAAQMGVLLAAGLLGRWLPAPAAAEAALGTALSRRQGGALLLLAGALLVALPLLGSWGPVWQLLGLSYRAGALVFGGGHVVLPLLEAELVPGWLSRTEFLAGYGAANAVPGPLFTVAAFVGAAQHQVPPLLGSVLATLGIFLPGSLLMLGSLPFWAGWARHTALRRALTGLNAAVVGLLLAAFCGPVLQAGLRTPAQLAGAALAYLALARFRVPAWAVVLACALAGAALPAAL